MPYTLNGIGTTYYGKKNRTEEQGYCDRCRQQKIMASYDTRLWFVILFVPIIPLGKKKIINYCSTCSHHYSISMANWNREKQNALKEGVKDMQDHPGDVDAALRMHGKLLTFEESQEARSLADSMAVKFSDNVDMQIYLGDYYDRIGDESQADRCFEAALKIAPEDLRARRAVGVGLIQRGEPKKAAELLAFMIQSDEDKDPRVLYMLARAYADQNDHASAFDLYRMIGYHFPSIVEGDKHFRKSVVETEAILGHSESILPRKKFKLNSWMGWALAAAGILVALFAVNLYSKASQKLIVLNHLNASSVVTISDDQTVILSPYATKEIKIAEGHYQVKVDTDGCPSENFSFHLANTWEQRFSQGKVFVLNVRGNAILIHETTTYSENPDPNANNPYRIYVGDRFVSLYKIDYKFAEFPETLQINDVDRVIKTRVGLVDVDPLTAINIMASENVPVEKTLGYIETNLNLQPNDQHMLDVYAGKCIRAGQQRRGFNFLGTNLQKPHFIEWHRWYQNLGIYYVGEEKKIVDQYHQLLTTEPDNSSLLYLVGRVQHCNNKAEPYFDRSIAADPENPYPIFAKAYHLIGTGQFKTSRRLLAQACRLNPDSEQMLELLYQARFALKEYAVLKKEVTQKLTASPLNWSNFNRLLEICAAAGDMAGVQKTLSAYKAALKKDDPQDPYQLSAQADMRASYLLGNMGQFIDFAGTLHDDSNRNLSLRQAYLLKGKMAEAEKTFAQDDTPDGYTALLLWYGWQRQGNKKKASQWLDRAKATFEASHGDEKQIAALFKGSNENMVGKIDDISIYPGSKRILYTVLGVMHPQQRKALFSKARKVNFSRSFPYHLIKQATGS